jgi:hypothetical protein
VSSLARTLTAAAPQRMVALSSIGGQHESRLGLITQVHILEEHADALRGCRCASRVANAGDVHTKRLQNQNDVEHKNDRGSKNRRCANQPAGGKRLHDVAPLGKVTSAIIGTGRAKLRTT